MTDKFTGSVTWFMVVGGSGITEVYGTMKDQFEELKKEKEEIKEEARNLDFERVD